MWQVEQRCRQGRDGGDQQTSWHSLALTCPRTCRLCDDASPTSCQLPTSWRGSWTNAATGAAVDINETTVRVSADDDDEADLDDEVDALTMGCVRWRTDSGGGGEQAEEEDLTMLVTVYGAGCRPRYRCARVVRRSSTLLYLQLSDASSWPLVRSPRDPVDCGAFQFDRWTAGSSRASTTSGYLLSLVAVDRDASVDCRLPPDVAGVQYEAEFLVDVGGGGARTGDGCSGTLTESGRTLRLAVSGCGSAVRRRFADPVYQCLESSRVGGDGDLVIITSPRSSSSSESSSLSCWLFTRRTRRGRGRPPSSLSFYLLTGRQCHAAVAVRSPSSFRPSRRLTHTALFSRPRPLPLTTAPSPRPDTTPRQSPDPDPSEPAWTSTAPRRPRPRNVTMADSDQDEQPVSAFVVGFVAVLMAVIQLILLLCHC